MRSFQSFSLEEYRDWLNGQNVTRSITHIQIHHTWKPRKTDYQGERTIVGMWRYHTENNGWNDIAQHATAAPDGLVWNGRSLNQDPAGIAGHNQGGYMIEIIGNFDEGEEVLEGKQLHATLGLVNLVMDRFNLDSSAIVFHREHAEKTCPGTGIVKDQFVSQVQAWRQEHAHFLERKEQQMSDRFSDVPANHYSTEAIEELAKLGIISGKSSDLFGFNEPISRQDVAVLIYRLYQHLKRD
jgi:hypothetical protein